MLSPGSQGASPAAMSLPGLYSGRVEAVEDENSQGRIKVSIPSIYGPASREYPIQARPCFPYGHFFVPQEGENVWIAFENGNPQSPVWLGIWYPVETTPESAQVSPPTKRVIETSAEHKVIFDDENNSITIEHGSQEKGKIVFSDDSLVLSFGKNSITLNSDGIQLQGNQIDLN